MTSQDYFALVRACDGLLLAAGATNDRVAVPWLHVIREHPVFLETYAPVFRRPARLPDTWDALRQRIAALKASVPAATRTRDADIEGRNPRQAEVLFVSHLLNEGQLEGPEDFYFGALPQALAQRGIPSVVALIDHRASGSSHVARPSTEITPRRLVLSRRLDRRMERRLSFHQRRAVSELKTAAAATTDAFRARVAECAIWYARGPETRAALRIGLQVEALVRKLKPAIVVTTHEGHAWERLAFRGARRGSPGVRVVGYHATALFRHQHALRRRLGQDLDPDVILSVGPITQRALQASEGLRGIEVGVLGSNRRLEAGPANIGGMFNSCVVIPEGIPGECRILFRAAIECARALPNTRMLLRLHPSMSFDRHREGLGLVEPIPANVVLSERPLIQDLAESHWALYRGSSAAIQALACGLRPIYVESDEPLTIDPLFNLETWRVTARSSADVVKIIRADRDSAFIADADDRKTGMAYAADYFAPLSCDTLARLVR